MTHNIGSIWTYIYSLGNFLMALYGTPSLEGFTIQVLICGTVPNAFGIQEFSHCRKLAPCSTKRNAKESDDEGGNRKLLGQHDVNPTDCSNEYFVKVRKEILFYGEL